MKAKWKESEIKTLFKLVESNQQLNKPMLETFKEFGKTTNRNALSVRNFYYAQSKLLLNNPKLAHELNIDVAKHMSQKFEHFDKTSADNLKKEIDKMRNKGLSTRSACLKLSGGDIKNMLRLQNKYRSMAATKGAKVIKFPNENANLGEQKTKLSDDDIKSLFMGLVKLVKEKANSESKEKAEKFLEQTEQEKRKRIIELQEKQFEIDNLRQIVNELRQKNQLLNKQLENYRIDYLNGHKNILFEDN